MIVNNQCPLHRAQLCAIHQEPHSKVGLICLYASHQFSFRMPFAIIKYNNPTYQCNNFWSIPYFSLFQMLCEEEDQRLYFPLVQLFKEEEVQVINRSSQRSEERQKWCGAFNGADRGGGK